MVVYLRRVTDNLTRLTPTSLGTVRLGGRSVVFVGGIRGILHDTNPVKHSSLTYGLKQEFRGGDELEEPE